MVLFIRKFPKLGIYVVMFTSILYTFTKFFMIFVLFLVAFALSFFTLFYDPQVSYISSKSTQIHTGVGVCHLTVITFNFSQQL